MKALLILLFSILISGIIAGEPNSNNPSFLSGFGEFFGIMAGVCCVFCVAFTFVICMNNNAQSGH